MVLIELLNFVPNAKLMACKAYFLVLTLRYARETVVWLLKHKSRRLRLTLKATNADAKSTIWLVYSSH